MRAPAAAAELRRARGSQRETFGHIADHLVAFAERNPEHDAITADIARLLPIVEKVAHDHGQDEDSGGIGGRPHKAPEA